MAFIKKIATTEQMVEWGEEFARGLQPGDVVRLFGTLGSGKTTFVKGVLKQLIGIDPSKVQSPTYSYIHPYRMTPNQSHPYHRMTPDQSHPYRMTPDQLHPNRITSDPSDGCKEVAHFDLYRLDRPNLFFDLDLDAYISPTSISLIEWAEKVPELTSKGRMIDLIFSYTETGREVEIKGDA